MPNLPPIKLTAFAWIGLCLTFSGQASYNKQALHRRSEIPPGTQNNNLPISSVKTSSNPRTSTANGSSLNATTGIPQNNQSTECQVEQLDQSTWIRLGYDEYLRSYPGGANLTAEAYAASKGAINFKCGIGQHCNIGQLCSPVKAPNWYILYAVQNVNVYLNTLYQVTGDAISLTQSMMASVWNDLFPSIIDHNNLKIAFAFSIVAAAIQAVGVLFLLFIPDPAVLFVTAPLAIMSQVNTDFVNIMLSSLLPIILGQSALSSPENTGPVQTEEFTSWSRFNYRLSKWQEETQSLVERTARQVFSSGINSDSPYSLNHLLLNGTFLNPLERKNSFEIQAEMKNVTKALAISALLRSMNAFVTITDDPHPSKKWQSKDRLSYLSPNGTLMNIIRVAPNETKAINDFKNGHVLFDKYEVSTEQIATISFECQQRFGIQTRNVTQAEKLDHRNPLLTKDISVCSFDLPVCDLRSSELKHQRHHNHKRVAKICRDIVGLPI